MKAGWEVKALGEVCELYQPKTITSKVMTETGAYPVFGANGIIGRYHEYNHEYPQLVIGCRGACGTVHLTEPKSWITGNSMVVAPRGDNIIKEFLRYFLLGPVDLEGVITGAAQPQITRTSLAPVAIPLPPLDEQKRIVAVLDAAFDGLSRARAHTQTNFKNARELFESVLRVAAESDAHKFGTVTLEELTLEVTDGDHMPPPKSKTGIPFITISDVRKDTREIDFSDTFMVPEIYFNNLKEKRRPRKGDILYTVTGATLGIPILITSDRSFCFQRHIGLVRPKATVNNEWLYFMMMSPYFFDQADGGATGAAQRTVSLGVLRGLTIPKIPLERQCELAKSFRARWDTSFNIAAHYRAKLADLDALRQALLQKAFAGELT